MSHDSGHDNSYEPKKILKAVEHYPFWTSKFFWFGLAFIVICALAYFFVS